MKDSTARKLRQIPVGSLLVGIDPHQKKHAVAVMTQDARVVAKFQVNNSREGFVELCQRVDQAVQYQGSHGAMYGIEAGSHYWRTLAHFLLGKGHAARLVNPYTLKRRREGEDLDRRKNDFRDATMAAELLRTGKFTESELPQGTYAELRAAYHAYRRVRSQQTRIVNLIRGLLDGLFPEFRQVFKFIQGKTSLAVLSVCPVPFAIARMPRERFIRIAREASPGDHLVLDKLRALHGAAQQSAGVIAGSDSIASEIRAVVMQWRLLESQANVWEDRMIELAGDLPESRFLLSIPGIGPVTVAGLLGELGPWAHYHHAKQLIKMAGTNPTEAESAGKRSARSSVSKKGRPALRRCLWTGAVSLLRHNEEFSAWAKALRERPAHPLKTREAVVAVGNRLLRVAYALVTHDDVPLPNSAGSLGGDTLRRAGDAA